MTKVVTRFAPSPTGFLHIGGVRTALFNYLYARQQKGSFALRIEDTDKERNKAEWVEGLQTDLAWLGLEHDAFAIQSEHAPRHTALLEDLVEKGHAYVSKETPVEPGQRAEVIRFKNPNTVVTFTDIIRGEVSVDTTDLGDFVIARSMTEPLYHLAVVIDDMDMGVTHVIRAEEHLSNTPRQILIQEALGASRPIYAHLPLVLAADKSKLSKRKHGETVSLTYYRERGYLSEAVINYVALLGWNPGGEAEIFSLEELINLFKLDNVQKGGAVFNVEKLDWVNRQHLEKLDDAMFLEQARPFTQGIEEAVITKALPLIRERVNTFGEILPLFEGGELAFLVADPAYDAEKLAWKKSTPEMAEKHLAHAKTILEGIDESSFNAQMIKDAIWDYAEAEGRGDVLWPLRYALTGQERSPDPFQSAELLGKTASLTRVEKALTILTA